MIDRVKPYWDINNLSQMKTKEDVAEAFEAFFVRTMIKEMRKSLPEGIFGKSHASKMYLDMMDMQMAQTIASSDSLKIKEFIVEALNQREKAEGINIYKNIQEDEK